MGHRERRVGGDEQVQVLQPQHPSSLVRLAAMCAWLGPRTHVGWANGRCARANALCMGAGAWACVFEKCFFFQ